MWEKIKFLKRNKGVLGIYLFFAVMILVLTLLYDRNMEYSFYMAAFYIIFMGIAVIMQYRVFKREKEKEKANLNEEYAEDDKRQYYQESEDFYALWTHQIKTPIAALNVLLNEQQMNPIACRQELVKIESYVEMALGYARYENMSYDLLLESCNLAEMVKKVVKKYATIFIYKHIGVKMEGLDHEVLTDEKWFTFILEQLISNALKYTVSGEISICGSEGREGIRVIVSDTGIGIKAEDIPRIFEKGFTGYNGRLDQKASGLGLYLSRGICNKLGHRISVESEVNRGTRVTVLLPCDRLKEADLTKM